MFILPLHADARKAGHCVSALFERPEHNSSRWNAIAMRLMAPLVSLHCKSSRKQHVKYIRISLLEKVQSEQGDTCLGLIAQILNIWVLGVQGLIQIRTCICM